MRDGEDIGGLSAEFQALQGLEAVRDRLYELREELEGHVRQVGRKDATIGRLRAEVRLLEGHLVDAQRRLVVLSQRELMVLSLIDGVDSGGRVMTVSELSKHIRTLLTVEDD